MPTKSEHDPVSADEFVYRRFARANYDASLEYPVRYVAFQPTPSDTDGISVFRELCGATIETALLAGGDRTQSHCIARIPVDGILKICEDAITLSVVPTPNSDGPGHASVQELNIKLREEKASSYRKLAQALANLAKDKVIYVPK